MRNICLKFETGAWEIHLVFKEQQQQLRLLQGWGFNWQPHDSCWQLHVTFFVCTRKIQKPNFQLHDGAAGWWLVGASNAQLTYKLAG